MAVNFRMGRRGAPLSRLNAQPRYRVTVWKPLREPIPPIPPVVLTLSDNNELYPADIANVPDWFVNADFTLVLSDRTISYVWVVDHWETSDTFLRASGTGTLVQGANSNPAQYIGAIINNYILGAGGVRIVASAGLFITWTGV